MRRSATCVLISALLTVGLVSVPAQATFPGGNGKIVITRGGDVAVIKADGTGFRKLTTRFDDAEAPSVSKDGNWVVFGAQGTGDFQMWKVRMDGTGLKRIYKQQTWAPSFSPDGKFIVFTHGDAIWRVKADGTKPKQLSDIECAESPRYSPNGQRITFNSCSGNIDIWIMDADGSDEQAVTSALDDEKYAEWAPDGERLSYITDAGGTRHVQTIEPNGANVEEQDGTNGANYFAPFSPNGLQIAFTDWDDDLAKRVPVGGSAVSTIGPVDPHFGISWQAT